MVSRQSGDEALDGVYRGIFFGPAELAGKAPDATDGLASANLLVSTAD
jgi:hypothetical protein